MGEKISRKIEWENGFRLYLETESKYRSYLGMEKISVFKIRDGKNSVSI